MGALGRTARYYRDNPEARKKHQEYQKKYNKKPGQSKKRSEDNKARKALNLRKGDTRDASRTKGGGFVAEDRSKNRGRQGANGKSTKK